jgi:CRISPR-associated endonuclease Csn1
LDYTLEKDDFDKQHLLQLWHLLYSFEGDNSRTGDEKLIQKLTSKFGFSIENAQIMAKINFINDYGSLSSKAIRKIMPYLSQGQRYDEACYLAKYNHSYSLTKEELSNRTLQGRLELLSKNSLRNPMVEKILNQMVHVVNGIIDDKTLGRPDEIRLELARELKYSADERRKMTEGIAKATKEHEEYRKVLENEFGISKVTRNDLIRYKLWLELEPNGYKTLYTNTYIPKEKLFSKEFDIEHIIPKARLFDDSFSNKTLAKREINLAKKDETAYDFLSNYLNKEEFEQYLSRINLLYKNKQISKAKYNKLKMKGDELPEDFIERDLRNTQYIAKKANEMLEQVVRTVNTTTGSITDRLRQDWDLVNIMQEINLHKYEKLGLVKLVQGKDGRIEKQIQDWSKRNDHRHHAVDALAVAFTTHSHVQYLNNLNARKDSSNKKHASIIGIEQKYLYRNEKGKLLFKPPMPINVFREEAKRQIENILISFKASNKVVTRNMNKIKIKGKDNYKTQITLTPRGQLHKESFYGSIKRYETKDEKINASFTVDKIKQVAKLSYRIALLNRLTEFGNDPKLAFSGKNALAKNPIYLDKAKTLLVPEKVKLVWMEPSFTIRKEITPELKIDKVLDKKVKHILEERLKEYNGNAKAAFSNINENPIWLNKEKGIAIKRVKITGVSNAIALHDKRNHLGEVMLDESGNPISTDFVSTGNNHHVAVYQDSDGNLFEEVVSFFEAVIRANNHLPIIDKNKENLDFLFSMKQNEYFVFPSKEFNPEEIDLLSQDNYALISKHLFRVQKLSTKNYLFVHHLETKSVDGETLKTKKELSGITFHFIHTPSKLSGIVKVQINHLGKIFHVGEI